MNRGWHPTGSDPARPANKLLLTIPDLVRTTGVAPGAKPQAAARTRVGPSPAVRKAVRLRRRSS